jgi:hypothetical protein
MSNDTKTGFQPEAFRPPGNDRGLLKVFRPSGKPTDSEKPVDIGGPSIISKPGRARTDTRKRDKD